MARSARTGPGVAPGDDDGAGRQGPGRRSGDDGGPRRSTTPSPARRLLSRILAINMLAPILLVGGLLYLDEYRDSLLEQSIRALIVQGELIAGALSEAAVGESTGPVRVGAQRPEIQQLPAAGDALDRDRLDRNGLDRDGLGRDGTPGLNVGEARPIVRRIAAATDMDLRLFDADGALVADSRTLIASGRGVMAQVLPPPQENADIVESGLQWLYDRYTRIFPTYEALPPRIQNIVDEAMDYEEALYALDGEVATGLRAANDNRMVITVAIPVQGLRRIVGAVLLETDSRLIDETVRQQRLNILQLFILVLGLTVLLSVFLARTIARPVQRLARAAEQVHAGRGRRVVIPDFTARRDEIGELSGSLRDMTDALYRRIDAIERFAADVAHELRNPLTSLRSAVETLELAKAPGQKERLMEIVYADVGRIDRLISDISDASRLDAELGRAEEEVVDVNAMLSALAEVYRNTRGMAAPDGRRLDLTLPEGQSLRVRGIEGRLGQVFRNLIDNALSFSPPMGVISVRAERRDGQVEVIVQDQGPGIPPENIGRIFQRFFTERPPQETFGEHSGLGLAICKQIVEAMDGTIEAGNAHDAEGNVLGARFIVRLPGMTVSR